MADIISPKIVEHISVLAKIPVSEEEKESLSRGFNQVLDVVNQLSAVETSGIEPIHHVTQLENIWREDIVGTKQTLSQGQALINAPRFDRGYFIVDRVLNIEF